MTHSEIINEITSVLTAEQVQLLKDTIIYGSWGDTEEEFIEDGKVVTDWCFGYCTNDAKRGGHFSGKKISSMFRSMFSRLNMIDGKGKYISHCSDWWCDGSGDMLFIRDLNDERLYESFEKWARE